MSCRLLENEHVDFLVECFFIYKIARSNTDRNQLGLLLRNANIIAYNMRYSSACVPEETEYTTQLPDHIAATLKAGKALEKVLYFVHKQASCYQYQASDNRQWRGSQAERYIAKLLEKIEKMLAIPYDQIVNSPIYTAFPWGIERNDYLRILRSQSHNL